MQANCRGFTTTETSAAGSLLYIRYLINIVINQLSINRINCNLIMNSKNSKIIAGVIYRHPPMALTGFSSNYLNKLLKNKHRYLANIYLLILI